MVDPAPAPTGQAAAEPVAPPATEPAAPQSAAQAVGTPVAPPAPNPTESAWYASIKEDHHGFIENKGWQNADALMDSYVNLEKMRGVPEDKLLKLPDAEDLDGFQEVYNRLGRPDSPDGYSIDGLDDSEYASWFKNTVHEAGLNDRQAALLQQKHDEYVSAQMEKDNESYTINAQNEMKELQHEWGQAYDQRMQAVKEGASKLGWSDEEVSQLEKVVGTKKMMNTLAELGTSLGEADYRGGASTNAPPAGGVMTREGAKAAYQELVKDNDFQAQIMSSDPKIKKMAIEKKAALSRMAFD